MSFLSLSSSKASIRKFVIFVIITIISLTERSCSACSSCMVSSVFGLAGGRLGVVPTSQHVAHPTHHFGNSRKRLILPRQKYWPKAAATTMIFIAMDRLSTHYGTSILSNLPHYRLAHDNENKVDGRNEKDTNSSQQDDRKGKRNNSIPNIAENPQDMDQVTEEKVVKPITAGMVGAIGFYKNFISPLLPPACRFLPTCSQYGVQAIEEFGPQKGLILTAWRLLRCSPFGGRGYDPPRWPPVSYTYGSY